MTAGYNYLAKGWGESGARPIPKLDGGGQKDKRYEMEHGKFLGNFHPEGGEILEQKPREEWDLRPLRKISPALSNLF